MDSICGVMLVGVRFASRCALAVMLSSAGLVSGSADCHFFGACEPRKPEKQTTQGVCIGHPINIATGVKHLAQDDYAAKGLFGVTLTRTYSSRRPEAGSVPRGDGLFGPNWRSTFDRRVDVSQPYTQAAVIRADGRVLEFLKVSGVWRPDADISDRLEQLGAGTPTGWRYIDGEDVVETYDAAGRLSSITTPNGLTQTLGYDALGRLVSVSDPSGRTLVFAYAANGFVGAVTDAAGGTFAYAYDSQANLVSVTYPDARVRTYHYNEPSLTQGTDLPRALTGITDERGIRYATYGYNADGKGILTELAGGADRNTIDYDANSATVFDALNAFRQYRFDVILGIAHCLTVSGTPTLAHPQRQVFNADGYVTSRTMFGGIRTDYSHNERGLETSRVEGMFSDGSPSPATRTITTEWHPDYRLPVRVAEPLRRTTYTYGAPSDANPGNRGSMLTKTIEPTADANGAGGLYAAVSGPGRTWTYTYNTEGQVLSINGPRTDVADVTTFSYYPLNGTCSGASALGCRGQLATMTNALGHTTSVDTYDVHGQPLRATDPNGLVTTFSYDERLRLTSRNAGGELTTFTYEPTGKITRITLPDGSFLAHTYDAAQRLTRIDDNGGNSIAYTLDAIGNRTKEDVLDPTGSLARTRSRVYDRRNMLSSEIGAQNQVTRYVFSDDGTISFRQTPLNTDDWVAYDQDTLGRLEREENGLRGVTVYGYNGLDKLVAVTDPRGLVTTYAYDGLDNLNQQVSPDTGTTTNTYDAAGNLLTATDAKGQQARYTYDALNRVTRVEHWGGAPLALTATQTYTYDGGINQKGRLTAISEPNSTTAYAYDQKGRLTSEARTINGVAYTTGYSYDAAGRLAAIAYPGGTQVAYTLDGQGRVQGITATRDGVARPVLSAVAYRPFGPAGAFTFGNGQTYARAFDADGRVSSYTLATQTYAVAYDVASRIESIGENGVPANTNTYGYDVLHRLTSASQAGATQTFGYDLVGNRTIKTVGSATSTYEYPATSNRLNAILGSGARAFSHDALGSMISDGTISYTYDARGRMARSVGLLGTTDYKVNALGQRIRKTNAQGDTVYHYDVQGRLIAESSASGTIQKEYIYLGDQPVGVLQ